MSETGVLSDSEILQCIKEGKISISPLNQNQLSNSSYDVTLGEYYYKAHPESIGKFFCPWNPEHLSKYWGEGDVKKALEVKTQDEANSFGCQIGDKIIVIKPGDTILAHTNEFIGGVKGVTTMMKARSSMGRSAVSICKCAGWGDVGYINRWTMEIQNSSDLHMVLLAGERVGQIVFFTTGETLRSYESKGSYQKSGDIQVIIDSWKPEMMLPRLVRDDNNALPYSLPMPPADYGELRGDGEREGGKKKKNRAKEPEEKVEDDDDLIEEGDTKSKGDSDDGGEGN